MTIDSVVQKTAISLVFVIVAALADLDHDPGLTITTSSRQPRPLYSR